MLNKYTTLLLYWFLLSAPAFAELNLELPDLNLPDFGAGSSALEQDSELGLKIVRYYRRYKPIVEDPELNSWIRSIGNKLATKSPQHGKLYFLIIKDPAINAFATPGGVVFVNTGLILNSDSESELAAVIAHEIAHVTQNHHARLTANAKSKLLGTSAAIIAGLVAGSQNSEAGSAIISGALATQQHQQLSFSRGMEAEADRVGIRILSGAGFKASGMPDFMTKLDRLSNSSYAQLTKYLQTHPLSIERVSDTRSRAQRLGNKGRDNPRFLYAREKIRALMNYGYQSQTPSLANTPLKNYASAIQLISRGQHSAALKLLGTHSNKPAVAIAIATALNGTHQYKKTIDLLTPLAKTRLGEQSLLIPLANALLAKGRIDEAWQHIRHVVPTEQTSLSFFEVKQEIAKRKGYIAEAYIAAADRNIRIGETKHAIAQLRQAMKLSGMSGQDTALLQSKLNKLM